MSDTERLWQAARTLLPEDVGCAVVPIGAGRLLPAEAEVMLRAVPRRRAEFAAGRLALRRAIAAAGGELPDDVPILPGPDRRPVLPSGLSVSLAHAGSLCIALASTRPDLLMGVDIEPVRARRPEGLAETVRPFRFRDAKEDALIVFCAKEALYKRQFAGSGRMLDFPDVALVVAGDGRFLGCLSGIELMRGRYLQAAGYHLAVSIGRKDSRRPAPDQPAK